MKEVRIIPEEEFKRREKNKQKVLLFGCLPTIIIVALIVFISSLLNKDKPNNNYSTVVQDFSLKPKEQLNEIYGKPIANNRWRVNDNDVEISDPIKNERNITFYGIDIFAPNLPNETGFTGGSVNDLGDGVYKLRFLGNTNDHLSVSYREQEKKLIVNIRNIE